MDYPLSLKGKGIRDDWNPPFSPNGPLRSKDPRKGRITNPSLKRIGIRRRTGTGGWIIHPGMNMTIPQEKNRNRRLDHPSRNKYDHSSGEEQEQEAGSPIPE